MRTKDELLTRIEESENGRWDTGDGIVFKKHPSDNDKGITATVQQGDEELNFWLMGHLSAVSDFFIDPAHTHATLGTLTETHEAAQKLAHFLGYKMPGMRTLLVPKLVVDHSESERLAGKVEAYEKILVGREISAKA